MSLLSLDSYLKQSGNQCHLLSVIAFFYPMDLP